MLLSISCFSVYISWVNFIKHLASSCVYFVTCRFQSQVASEEVGCVSLSLYVTSSCSCMTILPTGRHTRLCQISWVKSLIWGQWVSFVFWLIFNNMYCTATDDTYIAVMFVCLVIFLVLFMDMLLAICPCAVAYFDVMCIDVMFLDH